MQKTLIYIDTLTKTQILPSGGDAYAADYVRIERGQWQILCIQFVERILTEAGMYILKPAPVPEGMSMLLVGDNDFEDDNELMLKSYQSSIPFSVTDPSSNRFNIEGDWIGINFSNDDYPDTDPPSTTANPAKGQLSIRINADTEKFAQAVGKSKEVTDDLYISIKQYIAGIDNPSTIAWINFAALNTLRDWKAPVEKPAEGSALIPFIDSYLKRPIEMEFSSDGVTWYTETTEAVKFYRFRFQGSNSAWSTPIPVYSTVLAIEYSVNGEDWHSTWTTEDMFLRLSLDGGATWVAAFKMSLSDLEIEAITSSIASMAIDSAQNYVQTALANGEW